MITERDELMIQWLAQFKVATTNQINKLFYQNTTICNKRLLTLTKAKVIRRIKDPYSNQYLYSVKPIKSLYQIKHYYIRNDFYIKLFEIGCYNVYCRSVEKQLGSIVPDMSISFEYNNTKYMFFVEIERSDNKIDVAKYNRFFLDEYLEYVPKPIPVIYVTHKPIPKCNFQTKKVSLNLSDIHTIFS